MIELIKIILFGGSTVISPAPVEISTEPLEIVFEKSIKPLNCSASFNIDISEHITPGSKYPEFVKEAESKFSEGCLQILLKSESGDIVRFYNRGVTWGSPTKVSLNLKAFSSLNVSEKYSSMQITSCRNLYLSEITWYNYGKITCNESR